MNKDLDKRLKLYIAKMGMLETSYGVFESSAKSLEDALRARGINLKLYHQYKMPGGMSQNDFVIRLCTLEFFIKFYPKYAIKVLADKNLTASDKAKIFKYVLGERHRFIKKAKQYESEIRKLNPELANIKVGHPSSIIDGATFGFAPDEIAYFADFKNRNIKNQERIENFFREKYGINVTYVLAPKTAEKIITALKHYENSKEK